MSESSEIINAVQEVIKEATDDITGFPTTFERGKADVSRKILAALMNVVENQKENITLQLAELTK